MKLLRTLLKNSVVMLFATVLIRAITFAIGVVGARVLPVESYGLYSLIRGAVAAIEGVFSASLGNSYLSQLASTNDPLKKVSLTTSLLILASVVILIGGIVIILLDYLDFFGDVEGIASSFALMGFGLLLSTLLFSVVQKLYIAERLLIQYLVLSIFSAVLSILPIYILLSRGGLWELISCFIVFQFCDVFLKAMYLIYSSNWCLKCVHHFSWRMLISKPLKLFMKGKELIVIAGGFQVFSYYLRIDLAQIENGLEELAVWEVTSQLMTVVLLITGAITNIALQQMSQGVGKVNRTFIGALLITFFVLIFLSLIVYFYNDILLSAFGSFYTQFSSVLVYPMVLAFIMSVQSLFNKYFIVRSTTLNNMISVLASVSFVFTISMFYGLQSVEMLYMYLIGMYGFVIFLDICFLFRSGLKDGVFWRGS